jgi:hypothetical protein
MIMCRHDDERQRAVRNQHQHRTYVDPFLHRSDLTGADQFCEFGGTILGDRLQRFAGELYVDIALQFLHPDALALQVRQETARRAVVRVRHIVTGHRTDFGDFTSF